MLRNPAAQLSGPAFDSIGHEYTIGHAYNLPGKTALMSNIKRETWLKRRKCLKLRTYTHTQTHSHNISRTRTRTCMCMSMCV